MSSLSNTESRLLSQSSLLLLFPVGVAICLAMGLFEWLLFFWIILIYIEKNKIGLSPINPVLVSTAAFFVINIVPIIKQTELVDKAVDCTYLGFGALMVGAYFAYIMSNRPSRVNITICPSFDIRPIVVLWIACMFFIILEFSLHPELITESRGNSGVESDLTMMLAFYSAYSLPTLSAMIYMNFIHIKMLKKSQKLLFNNKFGLMLLIFISPILYSLLTQGRTHTVAVILAVLVISRAYVGTWRLRNIILLMAVSILFSFIALLTRGLGLSNIGLLFEITWDVILNSEENLFLMTVNVGHQLDILREMIAYTDFYGFQYGTSFAKSIINIIPFVHFFYDSNSFPLGVFYLNAFHANELTGYDFSGLAEMYMQGGKFAVVIVNFMIGLLLPLVFYRVLKFGSMKWILSYTGLIMGLTWWFRSDFLNYIRWFEQFFFVYFGYLIISKITGWKKYN